MSVSAEQTEERKTFRRPKEEAVRAWVAKQVEPFELADVRGRWGRSGEDALRRLLKEGVAVRIGFAQYRRG